MLKTQFRGGNQIDRVELPYVPLPEVVAHVFNAETWYLAPAQTSLRGTGLINNRVARGSVILIFEMK